ncbi:MAG TPA: hypothetical protein VIR63_04475, partial [Pontiella sp.]
MSKLSVVVIHYHLRPGGVTRVIERAVESLNDKVDLLVLSGEATDSSKIHSSIIRTFQPLAYSNHAVQDADKVVAELRAFVRDQLGRDPDIWHIHNHALGKNS